MNYFPFHIGDYASATRHLSWDEDLAYRRMLDWYYTNEKPLPVDLARVNRLMIATTDEQRAAIATVLEEFFLPTDEGWRHARADQELARMRDKQDANEERDDHEKTRMQKHRERRSAIFAQLAEVGVYPAWNAKTGELEKLIAENCSQPVTAPVTPTSTNDVTAPVTAPVTPDTENASLLQRPATAIPTPTPTPTPKNKNTSAIAPPDGVSDLIWRDFLKIRAAKKAPMTETALDGIRSEAEKAGISLSEALSTCCTRGWQGFKAKWLDDQFSNAGGSPSTGAAWEGAK